MTPAPISAVVLARGASDSLPACLQTLAWADERLVVLDDSRGENAAPALLRGVRVVERRWTDFADKRDAALRLAVNDWVAFVDDDERVPAALGREIRARVGVEPYAGYWVPRRNRMFGRWLRGGGWAPDFQLRVMDRRRARYQRQRLVHELAQVDGKVGRMKQRLDHLSYPSVREFRARQRTYAALAVRGLHQAGVRRRPSAVALQPLREFWRRLVRLRGYRDGAVGLLLALLMAEFEWRVQRGLRACWAADAREAAQ